MNEEWSNKENFLVPPLVESEPEVMNQIWKYEKMNIQTSLGLNVNDAGPQNSQIVTLIQISKDIMAKICPIVSGEYFTLALETFLAVQRKSYHWKEPFIAYNDYLRIYAALSACKDRATAFNFVNSQKCIKNNPQKIILNKGTANASEERIGDKIPEEFKSKGYEPIVESVWKIVVSTHSYCFKDFDDYYNDHHKYTVVLLPTFLNDINKLWFNHRNKAVGQEYAGVIGSAEAILDDIDKCATATRLISDYPFDLSRPSIDDETDPGGMASVTSGGVVGEGAAAGGGATNSNSGAVTTTPGSTSVNAAVGSTPTRNNNATGNSSGTGRMSKKKDNTPKGRNVGSSLSSSRIAKSRVIRSAPEDPPPRESDIKHIDDTEGKLTQPKYHIKKAKPLSAVGESRKLPRDQKEAANLRQKHSGLHTPHLESHINLKRHMGFSWKDFDFSTLDPGRRRRTAPISIASNAGSKKSKTSNDVHGKIDAWKKNRLTLNDMGYCLKKYDEPKKFLDQNCDL